MASLAVGDPMEADDLDPPEDGKAKRVSGSGSEASQEFPVAQVVGFVSGMELHNPDLLRAVPAWVVLRNFGQVLRDTSHNPADLYLLSRTVPVINEFWSHSWQVRPSTKIWLLLMLKNGCAAVLIGLVAALLAAYLSFLELLPTWYITPRIHGPGYSQEYRSGIWALLFGSAASLLSLCLWKCGDLVFLDRTCIHQGDDVLKTQALLHMGAFLKNSKKLVVLWDSTYLTRQPVFMHRLKP